MVEVMTSPACNVAPEADAFVVPRNPTDAVEVVRRHRGAEAEVVLSQSVPHSERRLRIWVEWREPLSPSVILDLGQRRLVLSEDEAQAHRAVHFIEHQVTDDHVGRPLARCRGTAKPFGRDPFQELRKDNEALTKYRKLLAPLLGHLQPPGA